MASKEQEDQVFARPSPDVIRSTWRDIFSDPLVSVDGMRAGALSRYGIGESDAQGGVVLRSVYWRFFHGLLPPPSALDQFSSALSSPRSSYSELRRRYLTSPDGRWADDCSSDDHSLPYASSSRTQSPPFSPFSPPHSANSTSSGWDPLSLDEQSPWKTWYSHQELRKTIRQDVDRTFPDLEYFTLDRVKRSLTTILFLYSVLNPDVGYRQGMHELLAVCLLVIDRDSLESQSKKELKSPLLGTQSKEKIVSEAMDATLDRAFVEHDAFELFAALMKHAKAFYEWRSEEGPRSRTTNVQAPIIVRCNNLHSSLIRRIDPQLWERLETEGVEAQIWAIRWIRLIFTRELPFSCALRLWDAVFAEDPGLGILDYICVAMLLLIRNELLDADHGGLLTNLLRYPSPSPTYPFEPSLIMSQALLLRSNVTPATGVEVVIQNQELLGVKAQPPEPVEPTHPARRRGGGVGGGGQSSRGRPPPQAQLPRGVQGLAAGLFERAQAAGLDKAILSTVADLRKNLPDSATAYSYLPNLPFSPTQAQRDQSGQWSSIPNSISALPRHYTPQQYPIPPPVTMPHTISSASIDSIASVKTLKDAERELAEIRLAMIGMGKAMTEWLDRLPTDTTPEVTEGLERVKESLLDAGSGDTEALVKEWGWNESLESRTNSRSATPSGSTDHLGSHAGPLVTSAGGEEETPKAPEVEVLLPPPQPPSLPVIRTAGQVKPPLYLSSRQDSPSAGLTRSPAPLSRPNDSTVSRQAKEVSRENEDRAGTQPDPLAGLGVGIPSPGFQDGRLKSRRDITTDPLRGL